MGIYLFFIAFIIESSFLTYCLLTKSFQPRVKGFIRLIELILFFLFSIIQVIEWSTRYYALAFVLVVMAILGIITIIYKKKAKKEYKVSRVIKKTFGMTFLLFLVTFPAILFPQYKLIEVTGDYKIARAKYTYVDENRLESFKNTGEYRKITVDVWYPENSEGTYPLIIYSHGGISLSTSNESLFRELASHGYVVYSIDHTYHSLSTTDVDGKTTFIDSTYMKELNVEDAKVNPQQSYEYYQKWMSVRTKDIDFVIDYIKAQAQLDNADSIYKIVDESKIGVIGHSLGGSAALCMGRMREDIKAVIALESPFMCDINGVTNGDFIFNDEAYPTPVLNVYSDSSWGHLGVWPQYQQNNHLLQGTNATAFNVHIKGVGHFTLTDLALQSPILTHLLNGLEATTDARYCLEVINKVSVEFFDHYLKGKGEFKSDGTY